MTWDDFFGSVCETLAKNSKCLSRQIGAVVVKDKFIIASGYNGPPSGVQHCDQRTNTGKCPRQAQGYLSGKGLDKCPAAHAEANAIFMAARYGISLDGGTLYLSKNCPVPCKDCLIAVIQAGIKEVVVGKVGNYYDFMSGYLIEHSGLKVREYNE